MGLQKECVMKHTLKTLALTIVLLLGWVSVSYAEWKKITETLDAVIYVDFERTRKHDGHVYWWDMVDLLKPDEFGFLSRKSYYQGDCKRFRFKVLSIHSSKEPMTGKIDNSFTFKFDDYDWSYPVPDSAMEVVFNQVCNR